MQLIGILSQGACPINGKNDVDSNPRTKPYSFIVLFACLVLLACASSATAAVTTTYLRPNTDIRVGGWSIVGAYRAWDALNDNVTEFNAPSNSNYVLSGEWSLRVGLGTTSMAGANVRGASAWIYTSNANEVTLEVRDGAENRLATGRFASAGWHSVWVPLNGVQSQLDNTYILLRGATGYGPGRASVYAAFLRLRLDRPDPPVDPRESRVYWGSWMDGDVYGGGLTDAPWDGSTWSTFESHAGKPASIVHFGQPAPWAQIFYPAPLELTDKRGAIPLMDMGNSGASLRSITSGSYDAYLTNWARAVRNYGQPFFLRWLWEMNGTWFPWGSEAAGNPALYVSAWRRFHDIAEAQGATNITWVWCPNTIFPGSTSLAQLYPGDPYVDWTCIDGYNFGLNPLRPARWMSFYELFSPTYNALSTLAPTKPVMIGETSSTEFGGSKSSWIANALGDVIPSSFPKIKAVNWFNWNVFEDGGQWDWPIESSATSQAAFASAISSPYYAANEFGDLPPLTRIQPLP